MQSLPTTQLIFVLLLPAFIALLAILVSLYRRLTQIGKIVNGGNDVQRTLTDATLKARSIVDHATSQAEAMLSDTDAFKMAMQKRVMEAYEHAFAGMKAQTDEKMVAWQKAMDGVIASTRDNNVKILQNVEADIKQGVESVTEKFMKEMQDRIMALANKRQTFIEGQLSQIDTDLHNYKKEQLERIENNIYHILSRGAEEVLGQAVNLDLHQELIIKALEQAKREGVFI